MVSSTVGVFKSGSGIGVIIPKDIVDHYNLKPGHRIQIDVQQILDIPIKERENASKEPEQSEPSL